MKTLKSVPRLKRLWETLGVGVRRNLMKLKTTRISIETCERIIVRRLPDALAAFCPRCRSESLFVMPERAAVEFNLTTREIFRLVEGGALHFLEDEDGLALVCRASLEVHPPRRPPLLHPET